LVSRVTSRAGFGTTTTFVLVIIGIALLLLLGGDMLSRGSRINIERAYATGQLLRVGRMALDEAFTSDKGKKVLADAMLKGIANAPGGPGMPSTPDKRDELICQFLQAIVPVDASGHVFVSLAALSEAYTTDISPPEAKSNEIPHKWPLGDPNTAAQATGMMWLEGNFRDEMGTARPQVAAVRFGVDSSLNARVKLITLLDAYKTELANGKLAIETDGQKDTVEIRPVAFHAIKRVNSTNYLGQRDVGRGVARARVGLRWALDKGGALVRTVVSEYYFKLHAPDTLGKTWKIEFDETEYQRGTIDDSEKDV
jgi:hypothetical protein